MSIPTHVVETISLQIKHFLELSFCNVVHSILAKNTCKIDVAMLEIKKYNGKVDNNNGNCFYVLFASLSNKFISKNVQLWYQIQKYSYPTHNCTNTMEFNCLKIVKEQKMPNILELYGSFPLLGASLRKIEFPHLVVSKRK